MKIGFIGAGRVGFSLGKYFSVNGIDIVGYYSKNKENAYLASGFTSSECYINLNDIVDDCDTLFLTVNDDSISEIAKEFYKMNIKNKIIIHTSGAKSSLCLGRLRDDNYCYSLHPIYAFSDRYESYKGLNKAAFTIEGHPKYMDILCNMIKGLGNNIVRINSDQKVRYHASCVMMSNLVNSLIELSLKELSEIGINDRNLFTPLILNNIINVIDKGPIEALTGPIKRNDINTIKNHLNELSDEALDIYSKLSLFLAKCLNKEGNANNEMINLLEGVKTYEKDN